MGSIPQTTGVYLIHLDTPLSHAKHYIGWASNIRNRLTHHRAGQGARMLQVCVERGITFNVVRVWPHAARAWERKLKNRKNAKILCPICNPCSFDHYPVAAGTTRKSGDECPF